MTPDPTPQGISTREQEVRDGVRLYRQISIVVSHSWPGEAYLRFETGPGMAVMVAVTGADLNEVGKLLKVGTTTPPTPRWHDGWSEEGRDGDGNLILRYEPSGGLYRILPIEES